MRVVSTLDRLGLRYLSADVHVLWAAGCWPLPLAVAERDDLSAPEPWREGERLERALQRAALADGRLGALVLKSGQLLEVEVADRVSEYVQERAGAVYVLDPELFDRDGRPRASERMVVAVAEKLVQRAAVLVANRADAAALCKRGVEGPATMKEAARALFDRGAGAVIVTGGHLEGPAIDWLYDGRGFEELGADRIAFEGHVRGAGGLFSTALAAGLARGASLPAAAHRAKEAASRALRHRLWVTAGGLLASTAVENPAERPAGYWIANPAAAAETFTSRADGE